MEPVWPLLTMLMCIDHIQCPVLAARCNVSQLGWDGSLQLLWPLLTLLTCINILCLLLTAMHILCWLLCARCPSWGGMAACNRCGPF